MLATRLGRAPEDSPTFRLGALERGGLTALHGYRERITDPGFRTYADGGLEQPRVALHRPGIGSPRPGSPALRPEHKGAGEPVSRDSHAPGGRPAENRQAGRRPALAPSSERGHGRGRRARGARGLAI